MGNQNIKQQEEESKVTKDGDTSQTTRLNSKSLNGSFVSKSLKSSGTAPNLHNVKNGS